MECGTCVFKTKQHIPIGKSGSRIDKHSFMLVFFFYLNMIIARETIHEGKYFTSNTFINDLINEWGMIIMFRKPF
jgi:hypothetical protein